MTIETIVVEEICFCAYCDKDADLDCDDCGSSYCRDCGSVHFDECTDKEIFVCQPCQPRQPVESKIKSFLDFGDCPF